MYSKNKLAIFNFSFILIAIFINNITQDIKTSLLVLLFLVVLFLGYFLITKRFTILLMSITFSFLIGIYISQYNINNINLKKDILNTYYNNKSYDLVFDVKDVYKIKEYNIEYIAQLKSVGKINIDKKILSVIKVPINYKLEKGYIIKSKTKIFSFKDTEDFAYNKYMISKNIYLRSNIYSYEIIKIKELNSIDNYLIKTRKLFIDIINKIYTKDEAIFLGGILIGARENMPNDLKEDFNNSGLTHFIAVSGFNITILIVFLTYILKYFPIILRVIVITITIILFTMLVGETAPVVRASIMGLIGYFAIAGGRKSESLSILMFTALIMTIYSPFSLNYDVSMHLSFLAVLGIMYTYDFIKKIFHFLPDFLEIKTAFTLTLSAMAFTLPIMILNFGQVSILSPLANISVAWTIPIAMLLGFISVIVYIVYPLGGIIFGYFTWILLKWDILVVQFFGNMEASLLKFDLGIYKYHLELLYFIVLVFLIIWFRKKEQA